ncbi:MAG: CDP-alcohol phosphatidyltransferase family protein [Rickettsiales bacterium]
MLETYIRSHFQRVLIDPIAKVLAQHFSPNQITIFSLITGLFAALCIALGWNLLACGLLLLSGYLDMLDGTVARMTGRSTAFGTMLDIMCDRTVEWAVIMGLYAVEPSTRGWLCLLMLGSVLIVVTSFLVAGIFVKNDGNKSFNYTPSLMERPEAFLFFMLMIFLPAWFVWLAVFFVVLVLYTAALRMWQTRKILLSSEIF